MVPVLGLFSLLLGRVAGQTDSWSTNTLYTATTNISDTASLSDFGDIDDHLRDFEKFLEPKSRARQITEEKNYFHQMGALPGIVEKSPKHSGGHVNEVYLTPS